MENPLFCDRKPASDAKLSGKFSAPLFRSQMLNPKDESYFGQKQNKFRLNISGSIVGFQFNSSERYSRAHSDMLRGELREFLIISGFASCFDALFG